MIRIIIGLVLLIAIGSIWLYMKIIDFKYMKGEKEMNKETTEKLWNLLSEEEKDVFRESYRKQKKEREETLNKIFKGRSMEEFYNDILYRHIVNEEQEEKEMGEKSIAECNHRTEDGLQDTIVKDPDTGEYKCSQCGYIFPSEDKKETDKKNSSFFKLMIVYRDYKERFHEFHEIPFDNFLEAKSKADEIIKAIPSETIVEKVVLCRCDMEF